MHETPTRRGLLGGALAAAGLAAGPPLAAPALARGRLLPTPEQTEGPFYPRRLPADADADLLRFGARPAPEGTPALVTGRVRDVFGNPLAGARIEIWQCDARGHYHHVGEGGARDPNFQGYGAAIADGEGRYAFRTIRPAPYPGRTPHIHLRVLAPGRRPLTTQLYVAGDPGNARDGVLQALRDPETRAALIRPFRPAPRAGLGPRGLAATFDPVLGG